MSNQNYLFKKHFIEVLLMTLFWVTVTTSYSYENFVIGFLISLFVSRLTYSIFNEVYYIPLNLSDLLHIFVHYFFLIFEIYKSAFLLCFYIVTKKNSPVLFSVKLLSSNSLILITVANSITLTPGTISVTASHNQIEVLSYCDDYNEGKDHAKDIKNHFEKHLLK